MFRGTMDAGFSVCTCYVSEMSVILVWSVQWLGCAGRLGNCDCNPGSSKKLVSSPNFPDWPYPLPPSIQPSVGYGRALSLRVQRLGHGADYPPHLMLRLKMSRAVCPLPICIPGVTGSTFLVIVKKSQDSWVSVVRRLWSGWPQCCVSVFSKSRDFSHFHIIQIESRACPSPPGNDNGSTFFIWAKKHCCSVNYKGVSKSSRTVLVKRSLLTLDVKFLHHLQSTPLFHEYSGPSVSAMLGSILGSPFLELCQVPAAIRLESLQWCWIFDPSSEASVWGRGKSHRGPERGEYGGWGITVMLFLAKNCETLKNLWAGALSWWIMRFWFCHFCGLLGRTFSRNLLRTSQ